MRCKHSGSKLIGSIGSMIASWKRKSRRLLRTTDLFSGNSLAKNGLLPVGNAQAVYVYLVNIVLTQIVSIH